MQSSGNVDTHFQPVRDLFDRALSTRGDWSAAVAAYVDGNLVVDLWGGPDYQQDSLQYVYSSTKGAASICLALQAERRLLDPDIAVASYWPEFAANGKGQLPVRWLLSHQAGLVGVDGGYSLDEYLAHTPVAEKLAAQEPYWAPGSAHGYHALTFGPLVDELSLRLTGRKIGTFFVEEISGPLEIEFFIGLPASEDHRIVPGHPPSELPDDSAWPNPDLVAAALNLGSDFPDLTMIDTLRSVRATELPAISGMCTARGLARLYAACISELDGHRPLLSPETLARASVVEADGQDLVLPFATSFGLGFQIPAGDRFPLAGAGSFGHDGYGGSLGYASPRHGLSFGFITNHTPPPFGGADPLTTELTQAILACLER